ncbi:MAG: hypothetical protein B7Y39_12690 [Bdellovibrio sp. 28-41-41]|nr:MAG: hypothetical protein B7Y39_12690 [Bdellovibrio sp. 28-41-41]
MIGRILSTLIFLTLSVANAASVNVITRTSDFEKDAWDAKPVYYYDSLNLPKELTREFLTINIQYYYNQYNGVTFRHLGDWRDFDHGHLLKDPTNRLRGVLFHTQERGNLFALDSRFHFINKELRNWLLFIDRPLMFENAIKYKYDFKPSFWNAEYEKNVTWKQYEDAGTVVELMLDPNKTGFNIQPFMSKEKTEQFYFKKAICPTSVHPKSNIIKIDTKEGIVCLYVTTMSCTLGFPTPCTARRL